MRIEKSECNYQVTECDLKFGEEITLDGELLIPISVLDKIKGKIREESRSATNERYWDGLIQALKIIDSIIEADKESKE